jgi:hypothetical protein
MKSTVSGMQIAVAHAPTSKPARQPCSATTGPTHFEPTYVPTGMPAAYSAITKA